HTRADTVRLWAERLGEVVNLPITFHDEQFSSQDAQDIAKQKKRKPTDPIDDLSARVILQRYLDDNSG
ncbi:MAG TPA: Holliday junction resolvase RuvX, partial [Aggregatilineales bacterium]|nr:Holliday junction resolvase RuvX [Aggregatilineales bacterium]